MLEETEIKESRKVRKKRLKWKQQRKNPVDETANLQ